MKKIKLLIILILLIPAIMIILTNNKIEKVSIKGNDRTIYGAGKENSYSEGKFTSENSSYELTGDGRLIVYNYIGEENIVTVEGEIDGHAIDDIDGKTFSHCENLEIIKVAKNIKNTQEIENFKKSQLLSNEQYTVYITTKEYNPEYIDYLTLSKEQKKKIEVVPQKFIVSVRNSNNNEENNEIAVKSDEIPTSYCMTYQNVINHTFQKYGNIKINVSDQGVFPLCNSFCAIKSFETYISLNYPDKKDSPEDFSDLHPRLMMSRGKQYDDVYNTGWLWNDGRVEPKNMYNGRYIKEAVGPVDESVLSYKDVVSWEKSSDETKRNIYKYLLEMSEEHYSTSLSQAQLDAAYAFIHNGNDVPKYYVVKSVGFNSISGEDKKSTDSTVQQKITSVRNQIKKHIMQNGSVRSHVRGISNTRYIQDANNSSNKMLTFYSKNAPAATDDSHGISIVGWDDNFSKDNFAGLDNKPEHDGAYLALNSWGENWGPQKGYFWISYDDYNIEKVVEGVAEIRNAKLDITEMSIDMYSQKEYTGNSVKPKITCKLGDDGETLEEHLDYEIIDNNADHMNAGKKTIKIKGIGRFQGEKELEYEILPRQLTVTVDSKTKKANEQDPELTYKTTGQIGNQVPKFTGKLQRQSGEEAGTYDITQGTLALEDNKSTGFIASNYTIKFVPGKLTIGSSEKLELKFTGCEQLSKNGKTYLKNVKVKTTSQTIKNYISTNGTIKVYQNDKEITSNIGTGMIIKVELGNEKQEFIAIVNGDANGDGEADLTDILKINKHRLNKAQLDDEKMLASDVNQDSKVDLSDILKINKYRLNKITQL